MSNKQKPAAAKDAIDLSDIVSEISWIADAADALVDDIIGCSRAAEERFGMGMGPLDGLSWTMGKLRAQVREALELSHRLAEASKTAPACGSAAA
jgi:hypothetical protein